VRRSGSTAPMLSAPHTANICHPPTLLDIILSIGWYFAG
jgi:hypothetical protein